MLRPDVPNHANKLGQTTSTHRRKCAAGFFTTKRTKVTKTEPLAAALRA